MWPPPPPPPPAPPWSPVGLRGCCWRPGRGRGALEAGSRRGGPRERKASGLMRLARGAGLAGRCAGGGRRSRRRPGLARALTSGPPARRRRRLPSGPAAAARPLPAPRTGAPPPRPTAAEARRRQEVPTMDTAHPPVRARSGGSGERSRSGRRAAGLPRPGRPPRRRDKARRSSGRAPRDRAGGGGERGGSPRGPRGTSASSTGCSKSRFSCAGSPPLMTTDATFSTPRAPWGEGPASGGRARDPFPTPPPRARPGRKKGQSGAEVFLPRVPLRGEYADREPQL